MIALMLAATFSLVADLTPYLAHTYQGAEQSHLTVLFPDGHTEGWFDMRQSGDATTFIKNADPKTGEPVALEIFYHRPRAVWLWFEWEKGAWHRWFYHENRRGDTAWLGMWASRRSVSWRVDVMTLNCPGQQWYAWRGSARIYEVPESAFEPIKNILTGETYTLKGVILESWDETDRFGERYYYAMSTDGRYAFGLVRWDGLEKHGQDVKLVAGGTQMNAIVAGEGRFDVPLPATGSCEE